MKLRPELDRLLAESIAEFDSWPKEKQRAHRVAQKRSWVRGELMLQFPNMTLDEANALLDRAENV